MHPQLQVITDQFAAAQTRLHALAEATPEDWWSRRGDPARWSAGECVAHLNLTARAFLPLIRRALDEGRRAVSPPPSRYRRDPIGWLLWRSMGPPVRHRFRTTAPFVPSGAEPLARAVETFDRLQAEQMGCVADAEGLPLGALRITSPFNARIRYNLYSCLTILPLHQHRHLWQAEQVLEGLRGGR
jgi:hypothetical protein